MNKQCFAKGTLIATLIDGNMKMVPVEELDTKDYVQVYALDRNGELVTIEGSAFSTYAGSEIIDMEFDNGFHFICTEDQPLRLEHMDTYCPAFVCEGECIETWGIAGDGESNHLRVKSITHHSDMQMYDFAAKELDDHSILVGNEDGICISIFV